MQKWSKLFLFSFQHRIRQASECKVSTESNQFSFKEKKRRQSVTPCNTCVLKQGHGAEMRRKRLACCYFDRANAFHLFTDLIEMSFAPLKLRSIIVRAQLLQAYGWYATPDECCLRLNFFARQVYFPRTSRIQFLMDLMYKGMFQLLFDFIVVDKLRKILKEKWSKLFFFLFSA